MKEKRDQLFPERVEMEPQEASYHLIAEASMVTGTLEGHRGQRKSYFPEKNSPSSLSSFMNSRNFSESSSWCLGGRI